MAENIKPDRQAKLKEIVRDLHEGSDIKSVRRKFSDLIRNVSPQEIADMEQALIAEGVPVEQVQKVCDVHIQVFEESLERQRRERTLPGHPVHTYREENRSARRIIRSLRRLMGAVVRGRSAGDFERELERLKEIEIHYRRKENQLFPVLERVGFTGPSKVMWGKHDEIRALLRDFESAYRTGEWNRFRSDGKTALRAMSRMIFMEERILFPTALKKLSDEQWVEIRNGESEIGYAWVTPGNLWDASLVTARTTAERKLGTEQSTEISLEVGALSAQQIDLMLKHLPVEVTFVDENDRVRYYSRGKERLFPRSPAIIGRTVQNCHPPKSIQVVERILESFRKGERDVAEFWLTMNDRFIHIRYFALRDGEGKYRGVMEVSQDVTDIRSLKGEKKLLDW